VLSLPHHDGSPRFVSTASPRLDDEVELRLRVPHASRARQTWIRYVLDGEPMFLRATVERTDALETWWVARLTVRNPIVLYRWRLDAPDRWLNQVGITSADPTDLFDFRLVAHDPPPDWAADAVFYQVFPDRFARSRDADSWQEFPTWAHHAPWSEPAARHMPNAMTQLYGGNFDGIIEQIDHLASLGVNAIYSTPFFPASSNHRYDAQSFDTVDPLLGGDAALARLTEALHRRGIRFVGDLTTNHTGSTHDWFVRAQADRRAEEASFYRFTDHPHDYEKWLGVSSLPKLDHTSPALGTRMIDAPGSILRRYLEPPFSMDGWRIDVANMTARLGDVDLNHEVGRRMRAAMKASNPDTVLIAEHCHDATNDLAGDAWYSTMNYSGFTNPMYGWLGTWFPVEHPDWPMRLRPMNGSDARATIDGFAGVVSWRTRTVNLNLLDSHDSVRFRSIAGEDRARHHVGVALLMSMPGMPSVFQGDEFGMAADHSHLTRAPVPWDRPETWDTATLSHFRSSIQARNGSVALRRGGFRWVSSGDDHLTFIREHPDETVLVHATRSRVEQSSATQLCDALDAAGYGTGATVTDLLHNRDVVARDAVAAATVSDQADITVLRLQ
jgi:alpha-glucosidase